MSGKSTDRRRLLTIGGAVFAGSLAGCLGDDSREEAHEMLEDTEEYHVQITQEFDEDALIAHFDTVEDLDQDRLAAESDLESALEAL